MKKIIYILPLIALVFACNTKTESKEAEEKEIVSTQVIKKETSEKNTTKGNYLCKINGKDWLYTKASGIISTHARTKQRTALITFKRKLEKGSENIQLHYDADTFELITASFQLKFENKEGKLTTCYYMINPDNKDRSPQTTMSGIIDLSNPTSASGTAEIVNLNISYEKEKLLNSENAIINITNLKFSGVGYSDTDKLANAFK